jgi:hypothetical protein
LSKKGGFITMKTKKFQKKLALNKKTIANLADIKMAAIKAGLLYESEIDPTACGGGNETDDHSRCLTCMVKDTQLNCSYYPCL